MFLSDPQSTSELHPDVLCECSFQLFGLTHPALHCPHQTLLQTFNFSTLTLSFHYTCHYTTHYITLTITPHVALRYTTQFSRHDITRHQTLYYTERNTRHIILHNTFLHITLDTSRHIALHLTLHSYKLWLRCLGCCHSGSRCVVKLCFSDTRSLPTQLPAALGAGVLWSCSSATRVA